MTLMKHSILSISPKKILIRSTNWIGDGIMTTPAVRTIRENFPEAEITLLALPWVADVFAASPFVDKIFLYEKKGKHSGIKGRLKLVKDLKEQHFDLTILLQNAFEAALITALARIPNRAGYTTDGRGLLLTHGVKLPIDRKKIHQVHYYQGLLQDLGLNPSPTELFLQLPEEARTSSRKYVAPHEDDLLIGINPGAAYGPAKRWPANKFAELAMIIHKNLPDNTRILIFGTNADRDTANIISEAAPQKVMDFTGRTSLAEAMTLIEMCNVFVTNDSGLMHVGAALKTPTIAIFGSTNSVTTGPYSDNNVIIQKDMPCSPCMKTHCKTDFSCMEDISSDEVYAAIINTLEEKA